MYQERGEVILMCLMNYSLFLLFILILYLNFRGKANFESYLKNLTIGLIVYKNTSTFGGVFTLQIK